MFANRHWIECRIVEIIHRAMLCPWFFSHQADEPWKGENEKTEGSYE